MAQRETPRKEQLFWGGGSQLGSGKDAGKRRGGLAKTREDPLCVRYHARLDTPRFEGEDSAVEKHEKRQLGTSGAGEYA